MLAQVGNTLQETPFLKATVKIMRDEEPDSPEFEQQAQAYRALVEKCVKTLLDSMSAHMMYMVHSAPTGALADALAPLYNMSLEEKKVLLLAAACHASGSLEAGLSGRL